ncbi:hypothetical protein [Adhaeretor mobilis]|uniref:Uncharacterized protein n=1 Tax=Adhaeretor mobilis TaxID=1930276 RepID=A0A517MQI7_9BACT|nr:hypothetical protein [Adhaeretor mobilis]QDS97149.1 hypothetical protein HG15A2_04090 [Adhaeretor mobilis]
MQPQRLALKTLFTEARTHLTRRQLFALGLLGALITLVSVSHLAAQQSRGTTISQAGARGRNGRQVALRDQLRVGLKAATKADARFIDQVVLEVHTGKLPRRLVDSTFLWARQRSKTRPGAHRLRPIIYFQPALTLQARRLGVRL